MKIYHAYAITNLINGKLYIGICENARQRWRQHLYHAEHSGQAMIHRAIRKHGADKFSFEVIASTRTWDEAKAIEKTIIQQYHTYAPLGRGYNLTKGGDGVLGLRFSPETLSKMSRERMGRRLTPQTIAKIVVANTGLKRSDEFCSRMSLLAQSRTISLSAIEKMSATKAGKPVPQQVNGAAAVRDSIWINNGNKCRRLKMGLEIPEGWSVGRPEKFAQSCTVRAHSDKSKAKMSATRTGRAIGETTKDKLSVALKGKPKSPTHIAAARLARWG